MAIFLLKKPVLFILKIENVSPFFSA